MGLPEVRRVAEDRVEALRWETSAEGLESAEVALHQGNDGKAYQKSLHDVWEVMYGLQH